MTLMKTPTLFTLLLLTFTSISPANEPMVPKLANPDFEEGTADNPALGWIVEKNGEIELTQEMPVSGKNALVLKKGYVVISQNLQVPDLYKYKFRLDATARSPDFAAFGIRVGYYRRNEAGNKTWYDRPLIWDKVLDLDNKEITAEVNIADDVMDDRFWIGFYRSKNEGTIILDAIKLEFEPK